MSSQSTVGTNPADDEGVALRTSELTKQFGEFTAVDGVSMSVADGELRAVIGPNGAGKTTLFNMIMGRLSPTRGSVYLRGDEITEAPEEERPHRGIARSFQSNQLFADETVLENVRIVVQTAREGTFALNVLGRGKELGRDRAVELLEHVDLLEEYDKEAKNLSHGDQRRLGIAMALATDPSVLLLDEPTSGMSPASTTEAATLIEDIRDAFDLTVVLIEHDMDVVLSIADQISVLNRGQILATGTPDEIQENQEVQDAYLGGVREEV